MNTKTGNTKTGNTKPGYAENGKGDDGLAPEARLARARWRSRRGLLELELLLTPFARERLPSLPTRQLEAYERLLGCDDLDVHAWLLAREAPPADFQGIVAEIRRHLALG
ncbi:MAG: succinate dehydrogenase assembly factor 2 [Pseudomonadales bacterium]